MFVSAAIAGGAAQRVLELASDGVIRIVASPRLFAELSGVLARERFLRWRSREDLDRFIDDTRALVEFVDDPAGAPAVTRDPDDDYLVALASAVAVTAICSGDQDLVGVDVLVLSPAELVRRVIEHD